MYPGRETEVAPPIALPPSQQIKVFYGNEFKDTDHIIYSFLFCAVEITSCILNDEITLCTITKPNLQVADGFENSVPVINLKVLFAITLFSK